MTEVHTMIRTFVRFDIALHGFIQESTFDCMRVQKMDRADIREYEDWNKKLIQHATEK